MQRERPTAVLVMAILNFIFGGLGILGLLCGGGAVLFLVSMASSLPPGPGGGPNPLDEMLNMYKSIPGFIPYMLISSILGSIVAILLLVAGYGLLNLRPWARWLCIAYGIYAVVGTIGSTVYSVTVMGPAMQAYQEKMFQKKGLPPPPNMGASNAGGAVVGAVFGIAFGVAQLIVMNMRDVRAAFTGVPAEDGDDRGRGDYGGRSEGRFGDRYEERGGEERITEG